MRARWTGRGRVGMVAAVALALVAACGEQPNRVGAPDGGTRPSASSGPGVDAGGPVLPSGWRWESFGGVEVGVPGDWGHASTGRQWCTRTPPLRPYVGRPGAVTLVGCRRAAEGVADPGTLVSEAGSLVWFEFATDDAADDASADAVPRPPGDRETVRRNGVRVDVQAPVALRRQILDTVHTFAGDDHQGCPLRPPFGDDPTWRPAGPPIGDVGPVREVSACRYDGSGRLFSSLRVSGGAAVDGVAALADAPVGGGPDAPASDCGRDDPAAEDVLVLLVRAREPKQVLVRYGGCTGHGIDDGTAVRALTRPALAPFAIGPNRIVAFMEVLADVVPRP